MIRTCPLAMVFGLGAGIFGSTLSAQSVELTPAESDRLRELDGRPLYTFSNVDLSDYLELRKRSSKPGEGSPAIPERAGSFTSKTLGQPYRLNALLSDWSEGDCVTFTERLLALSCVDDWTSYYRLLKRLRYKDGNVSFLELNFFPLADWVPNNRWLFNDITGEMGSTEVFTEEIYRKAFYRGLKFGQGDTGAGKAKSAALAEKISAAAEKELLPVRYLPSRQLQEALPRLRTGDVVFVIKLFPPTQKRPEHLDCDHMGLIVLGGKGEVYIAHAAPRQARRQELVEFAKIYTRVRGFVFLRIREDASTTIPVEIARVEPQSPAPQPSAIDERIRVSRTSR